MGGFDWLKWVEWMRIKSLSLEFDTLATSKVTYDNVHSWWVYSAGQLGNQAASSLTWYSTQSRCLDTKITSPNPISLIPSTKLGSDKYQCCNNWFDYNENQTPDLQHGRPALNQFHHRTIVLCHTAKSGHWHHGPISPAITLFLILSSRLTSISY